MNILNKLTIKHLKMNKKRTIVTIIGIILSTALMVGIGLILSTVREAMIDDIKMYRGDYNVRFNDIESDKIDIIKNNTNVDSYIYRSYVGYSKINDEQKEYYKVYNINDEYTKHLKLLEGRFPNNENEIIVPSYLVDRPGVDLEIGKTIYLDLGDRYLEDELVKSGSPLYQDEYIKVNDHKEYTVVGIIERDYYEDHEIGCFIYTKGDKTKLNEIFVIYKNISKTFKYSKGLSLSLGITLDSDDYYQKVDYNESLLSFYGVTKYDNLMSSMIGLLSIMLVLVSVACIIVIYNSFAISVMERKKQFGLFSSIGATKQQIRKTVLFEAFVVSIIGIPLGILGAYLGIGIVILILNNLLSNIIFLNLKLVTYSTFLIVPIIFMLATIFISAFIPAKKASKISPIEAIRLNDDIKIKGKKVKSPKWIKKLFGIEGDLAYKNMKRNKKKYRITVVSLFISIVMFISFSGFMRYTLLGMYSYVDTYDFDIILTYEDKNADLNVVNEIITNKDVKEYSRFKRLIYSSNTKLSSMYTKKYHKFLEDNDFVLDDGRVQIVVISDNDFEEYLDKIGKKVKKPVLFNTYNGIVITSNNRKGYSLKKYENNNIAIDIENDIYDEEKGEYTYEAIATINDYYLSSETFMGLETFDGQQGPIIVMDESLANKYNLIENYKRYLENTVLIKAPSYKNIDKLANKLDEENKLVNMNYQNIKEEVSMMNNLLLALKILVYGFITLVTLIGVTSVFNTINTSIALRRKEFAVLRSIGLTPKGFNKTLMFESLFFGIKSLIYAIPFSMLVICLIAASMAGVVEFNGLIIPWESILLAILGVFIIVFISMTYATRKVKKDNILDAIREENI